MAQWQERTSIVMIDTMVYTLYSVTVQAISCFNTSKGISPRCYEPHYNNAVLTEKVKASFQHCCKVYPSGW